MTNPIETAQKVAKKKTASNPKGAGRPSLSEIDKQLRRKESIKAYKNSKKEFKCMIDPNLHERLVNFKQELDISYEEMLAYMLDKSIVN